MPGLIFVLLGVLIIKNKTGNHRYGVPGFNFNSVYLNHYQKRRNCINKVSVLLKRLNLTSYFYPKNNFNHMSEECAFFTHHPPSAAWLHLGFRPTSLLRSSL